MLYSLMSALAQGAHDDDEVELLVRDDCIGEMHALPDRIAVKGLTVRGNRFSATEIAFAKLAADAALFTNYYTPFSARRRALRSITVVHDLQFRTFPEYFTPQKRAFLRHAIRATCRRADRVVAISEFTRHELRRFSRDPMRRSRLSRIPLTGLVSTKRVVASRASVSHGSSCSRPRSIRTRTSKPRSGPTRFSGRGPTTSRSC